MKRIQDTYRGHALLLKLWVAAKNPLVKALLKRLGWLPVECPVALPTRRFRPSVR
ncbi:MAG: hypothetical protein O3C60_06050 [Planctomycetota bacterium]|nr:hypothetical protein [Planctomycetota bacterium]